MLDGLRPRPHNSDVGSFVDANTRKPGGFLKLIQRRNRSGMHYFLLRRQIAIGMFGTGSDSLSPISARCMAARASPESVVSHVQFLVADHHHLGLPSLTRCGKGIPIVK